LPREGDCSGFTIFCLSTGVYYHDDDKDVDEIKEETSMPQLGHGGEGTEIALVPRLVEALAGKNVVGAAAGVKHTAVWTEGELFTFGNGGYGRLGHGGTQIELVPRLVEALAGKMVIGAAAGDYQTAAWTDAGELFTFEEGKAAGPWRATT